MRAFPCSSNSLGGSHSQLTLVFWCVSSSIVVVSVLFFVPVEIIKIFYTFIFLKIYPIFLFQFLVLLLSSRYNEKQKFFAPDADATGRQRDNEEEQIHIPNLFLNMLQSQLFFNVPSSRKYSDRKIEGKTLSQFSQMRALNVHKENIIML